MGRITLDGKVSQYSTGEDVQPKFWDANKGRAVIHGQNPETSIELRGLNRKLEELEEKARTAYKKSVDSAGYVSAEIIKNAVTGKAQPKEHLLALFDEHNEEYAKRVGIDRTHHTYPIFDHTKTSVQLPAIQIWSGRRDTSLDRHAVHRKLPFLSFHNIEVENHITERLPDPAVQDCPARSQTQDTVTLSVHRLQA